jgi:hypothetical protein
MKKLFKKNHWSTEDMLIAGAGVVAAVGIFAIIKQHRDAAAAPATPAPTSGLRGLGAYFIDPVNIPFSGLGSNYVAVH